MRLVKNDEHTQVYKGEKGEAVITRNLGGRNKKDYWNVAVSVNGSYKKLATRTKFERAYFLAEEAID